MTWTFVGQLAVLAALATVLVLLVIEAFRESSRPYRSIPGPKGDPGPAGYPGPTGLMGPKGDPGPGCQGSCCVGANPSEVPVDVQNWQRKAGLKSDGE